tara:strand:- start:24162 stop:24992 length:831 start_codon:yes stop_codon:yes gene_type:complete
MKIGDIPIKFPDDDGSLSNATKRSITIGVILVAVLGITTYWFLQEDPEVQQVNLAPVVEDPAPPQEFPPVEREEPESLLLPDLNTSDRFVRNLLSALSAHPKIAEWLTTKGLVRLFVVTIDNIADGQNPSNHISFLRPTLRFSVTTNSSELKISPESYNRYDLHAAVFDSFSTMGLVKLFQELEPLLDEAYAELGQPDIPFRRTFKRAVTHILETPNINRSPLIEKGVVFHRYVDPRFEVLSPAQKQFLGMGPGNMQAIKSKLQEFSTELGLSAAR